MKLKFGNCFLVLVFIHSDLEILWSRHWVVRCSLGLLEFVLKCQNNTNDDSWLQDMVITLTHWKRKEKNYNKLEMKRKVEVCFKKS